MGPDFEGIYNIMSPGSSSCGILLVENVSRQTYLPINLSINYCDNIIYLQEHTHHGQQISTGIQMECHSNAIANLANVNAFTSMNHQQALNGKTTIFVTNED